MIVMVSNHTSWRTHYLQGKHGGLGLLLPPNGLRGPYPHLPYAIDNGAFPAWSNGEEWDEDAFLRALDWTEGHSAKPRWVVVPDVVTDAEATMESWVRWAPRMRERGLRLALAVQDGMTPADAEPLGADVIFVGGSTEWKMGTLTDWCRAFPRVHVGRINGLRGLMACHAAGAESVDGTGYFRAPERMKGLVAYLREYGCRTEYPMNFTREHQGQGNFYE